MIPEKFKERMRSLLGDEYDEFIHALENDSAVRSLRVNGLKCSVEKFEELCGFSFESLEAVEGAYIFNEEKIGGDPLHHAGAYYVQDPSAMLPVVAAREFIWPGMNVLDMCAAPGGKTSQLAVLLHGEGMLVSNEKVTSRARILQGNVERMGIRNAVVINCNPDAVAKNYRKCFDFVLCDAPCSGEGMFRKYDNAGDEWSEENVQLCAARQKEILHYAAKCVAGGGYLMYSTCTFSVEENEEVVKDFLASHENFEAVELPQSICDITACGIDFTKARRFYPHKFRGEGQFLCLMKKISGDKREVDFEGNLKKMKKEDKKVCENFLRDCLGYVPDGLAMLRENAVIADGIDAPHGSFSCGVTLGEVTKGRLVPHHHFFSAFGNEMVRRVDLEPGDPRLFAYLKGEGFNAEIKNGWCAVTVGGIPVGGGKAVDGYVKNHYPKGLRLREQ